MINSIGNMSDVISTYSAQKPAQLQKPEVTNPAITPEKVNKTQSKPLTSAVAFDSPVNESGESSAEETRETSGQRLIDGIRQLASQEDSRITASASQTASSREAGLKAYQQTAWGISL
jgi:hypothetical protein